MNSPNRWPDQTLPVEIYCAPDALSRLESFTKDGMLAMPRIGLGVGGFLLGKRDGKRLDILGAKEIPCAHAMGPSFSLAPEEVSDARGLCGDSELAVLGFYCSKTVGPMALSPNDTALFDALCPEAWQTALVIRPARGSVTLAAFGVRSGGGVLLGTAQELLPRVVSADVESEEPEVEAPKPELPVPEPPNPELPKPEAPKPELPKPEPVAEKVEVNIAEVREETPPVVAAPAPPRVPVRPAGVGAKKKKKRPVPPPVIPQAQPSLFWQLFEKLARLFK